MKSMGKGRDEGLKEKFENSGKENEAEKGSKRTQTNETTSGCEFGHAIRK